MIESNNTLLVSNINIRIEEFPLVKSYKLSFATLEKFISIQTDFTFSNQKKIKSEVVPLFGYNNESKEIILENIKSWRNEIIGRNIIEARSYIKKYINQFPFSTSPILTAIDLLEFPFKKINHDSLSYVVPTSTTNYEEFKNLILKKEKSIKVKLTGNLNVDIEGLNRIKNILINYPYKIRFDANQAYNYDNLKKIILHLINNNLQDKIQYIEQPLPVGMEEEIGKIRAEFKQIEIMLDESIISISDLKLALNNNINFIKLKLFKQGGIKETIDIAKEAKKKKINIILGNGVATHISNFIENQIYIAYPNLFISPLESNGFKKIK